MSKQSESQRHLDVVLEKVNAASKQLKQLRRHLEKGEGTVLRLRDFKLEELEVSVSTDLGRLEDLSSILSRKQDPAAFNKHISFLIGLRNFLQSYLKDYGVITSSFKSTLPEEEIPAQKVAAFRLRAEAYECTLAIAVFVLGSEKDRQDHKEDLKRYAAQSGNISGQLGGIRAAIDIIEVHRGKVPLKSASGDAMKDLRDLKEVLKQCMCVCAEAPGMVRDEGVNVGSSDVVDAFQMIGYAGNAAMGKSVNVGDAKAKQGAVSIIGIIGESKAFPEAVGKYTEARHKGSASVSQETGSGSKKE